MKRFIYIFPVLLFYALMWVGCTYEEDYIVAPNPNGLQTAEISFMAESPPTIPISLRAIGTVQENTIHTIYVLVFDKSTGDLLYKTKGKNLLAGSGVENSNKYTFKATLPVGNEYTFMVLANAEEKLQGIEVGMSPQKTKQDVLALTVKQEGKWNLETQPIPMWGEKNLNLSSTDTPVFALARMMARVHVEVNLREIEGVDPNNFELTSVRLYNYNTVGMLVPDPGNYDSFTPVAIAPTIPANPGTQTEPLIFSGTDITDQKYCKGKIYMFEASHNGFTYQNPGPQSEWVYNPCLVIGGKYTTPQGTQLEETFYRVDFIRKDDSDPNHTIETWLSVLRNFSYNITIVHVSGAGFPDVDMALHSAPINMEAALLEWDEGEMGEIAFDGTFFLSVSKDQFTVSMGAEPNEKESNTFYIKTDYIFQNDVNHSNSGWSVEKYVDAVTELPVHWLELHPDHAAPDAYNKVKVYFTHEENDTGQARTAVIWIAAGRLRYPVYVTQKVSSILIVNHLNNDEPIDRLEFEVPVNGSAAMTKPFKVIWTPTDQPVSISEQSTHSWRSFPAEWLNPNPASSGWILSNGIGQQIYHVTAPSVDASLVQENPFYERESVYTFTVDDGTGDETKSISLHQVHFNVVVDQYDPRLDGKTHHLSVRSNTEWEITNIEEWLFNEDPATHPQPSPVMLSRKNTDNLFVGASGGPNINGESLSFTTVDQRVGIHEKKWGTVFVTFESPNNKFAPFTVELRFPARRLTFLGLGYTQDDRPFNPGSRQFRHNQGINRMLTAEINFGNLPHSKIKTEPFEVIAYNCEGLVRAGPGLAPDYNWYAGAFRKWLNEHNPDIIFCTYSMRFQQTDAQLLKQYLDQGGAVILYYGGDVQLNSDLRLLMNELLEINLQEAHVFHGTPEGAVYRLEDIDDPILDGPFGNVRGQNFGTHIYHTGIEESMIADQVEVLCRMENMVSHIPGIYRQNKVNIFRHKTKNLFWVGNAMGTAAYFPGIRYWNYDPIRNDDQFNPTKQTGFGPGAAFEIYNSYVVMNAIAWAMSVTNHTAPGGGY